MTAIRVRRRAPRRGRADVWSDALRGAAVAVVVVGLVGSALIASTFARSLDLKDRYPGLQAIGWRSVVTDEEADEFVARNRADGEPAFTIRPPPPVSWRRWSVPAIPGRPR